MFNLFDWLQVACITRLNTVIIKVLLCNLPKTSFTPIPEVH